MFLSCHTFLLLLCFWVCISCISFMRRIVYRPSPSSVAPAMSAAAAAASSAAAVAAAKVVAPWADAVRARVGTAGLVGPQAADDLRLTSTDSQVPAATSPLVRLRVPRAMLRNVQPGALSDWLAEVAEAQPHVALWQVDFAQSDCDVQGAPGLRLLSPQFPAF